METIEIGSADAVWVRPDHTLYCQTEEARDTAHSTLQGLGYDINPIPPYRPSADAIAMGFAEPCTGPPDMRSPRATAYGEIPNFVMIFQTWEWAPARPDASLGFYVLQAAGCQHQYEAYVAWSRSSCDVSERIGREQFEAADFEYMRKYIDLFTTLDAGRWDQAAEGIRERTVAGAIPAILDFCQRTS